MILSGGIDSATTLYMTKLETDDIYSLNMIYSQAYDAEAEAAKKLAAKAKVKEHITLLLPFFKDITDRYHPLPSAEITSAYVPARNIVFYGAAAAYAECIGADRIVFGSNADDARELPDAQADFIQLMNELISKGTRIGREGSTITVITPLIQYNKTEVLRVALDLGVPLELTWSCFENGETPCGTCRGCLGRSKAFLELGKPDPLLTSMNATR